VWPGKLWGQRLYIVVWPGKLLADSYFFIFFIHFNKTYIKILCYNNHAHTPLNQSSDKWACAFAISKIRDRQTSIQSDIQTCWLQYLAHLAGPKQKQKLGPNIKNLARSNSDIVP